MVKVSALATKNINILYEQAKINEPERNLPNFEAEKLVHAKDYRNKIQEIFDSIVDHSGALKKITFRITVGGSSPHQYFNALIHQASISGDTDLYVMLSREHLVILNAFKTVIRSRFKEKFDVTDNEIFVSPDGNGMSFKLPEIDLNFVNYVEVFANFQVFIDESLNTVYSMGIPTHETDFKKYLFSNKIICYRLEMLFALSRAYAYDISDAKSEPQYMDEFMAFKKLAFLFKSFYKPFQSNKHFSDETAAEINEFFMQEEYERLKGMLVDRMHENYTDLFPERQNAQDHLNNIAAMAKNNVPMETQIEDLINANKLINDELLKANSLIEQLRNQNVLLMSQNAEQQAEFTGKMNSTHSALRNTLNTSKSELSVSRKKIVELHQEIHQLNETVDKFKSNETLLKTENESLKHTIEALQGEVIALKTSESDIKKMEEHEEDALSEEGLEPGKKRKKKHKKRKQEPQSEPAAVDWSKKLAEGIIHLLIDKNQSASSSNNNFNELADMPAWNGLVTDASCARYLSVYSHAIDNFNGMKDDSEVSTFGSLCLCIGTAISTYSLGKRIEFKDILLHFREDVSKLKEFIILMSSRNTPNNQVFMRFKKFLDAVMKALYKKDKLSDDLNRCITQIEKLSKIFIDNKDFIIEAQKNPATAYEAKNRNHAYLVQFIHFMENCTESTKDFDYIIHLAYELAHHHIGLDKDSSEDNITLEAINNINHTCLTDMIATNTPSEPIDETWLLKAQEAVDSKKFKKSGMPDLSCIFTYLQSKFPGKNPDFLLKHHFANLAKSKAMKNPIMKNFSLLTNLSWIFHDTVIGDLKMLASPELRNNNIASAIVILREDKLFSFSQEETDTQLLGFLCLMIDLHFGFSELGIDRLKVLREFKNAIEIQLVVAKPENRTIIDLKKLSQQVSKMTSSSTDDDFYIRWGNIFVASIKDKDSLKNAFVNIYREYPNDNIALKISQYFKAIRYLQNDHPSKRVIKHDSYLLTGILPLFDVKFLQKLNSKSMSDTEKRDICISQLHLAIAHFSENDFFEISNHLDLKDNETAQKLLLMMVKFYANLFPPNHDYYHAIEFLENAMGLDIKKADSATSNMAILSNPVWVNPETDYERKAIMMLQSKIKEAFGHTIQIQAGQNRLK